jgi:hypothetical protein
MNGLIDVKKIFFFKSCAFNFYEYIKMYPFYLLVTKDFKVE